MVRALCSVRAPVDKALTCLIYQRTHIHIHIYTYIYTCIYIYINDHHHDDNDDRPDDDGEPFHMARQKDLLPHAAGRQHDPQNATTYHRLLLPTTLYSLVLPRTTSSYCVTRYYYHE